MHFNHLSYSLICNSCNTKTKGETTIFTEDSPKKYIPEKLGKEIGGFSNLICESCKAIGEFRIHSTSLNGSGKILKKFELTVHKNEGKLKSSTKFSDFSDQQLDEIYIKLRARIEELKGQYIPIKNNGYAHFLVEIIDLKPYIRVTNYETEGISTEELIDTINSLTGKENIKGISGKLNKKLEDAFEDLKANQNDPLVITHLQSKDKLTNFYIIAKLPDAEIYYGILTNEYTQQKIIEGIPLVNFEPLDLIEVPMTPFKAVPFIIEDKKRV